MDRLQALGGNVQARYHHLNRRTKTLLWGWVILQLVLLAWLTWYSPKRLFQNLANWANGLHESNLGWLLLGGLVVVTAFPPLFGFSTCVTICGFTYGLRDGFLLALTGTLSGATLSFLLARLLLNRYAEKMLERQTTLKALGGAIKEKGLPLVILIRLCPFPYSYSNFFFATVRDVPLVHFFLATCAYGIKILLHVYIGTRIYLFSDPEHRESMDTTTKVLNSLSVVFSVALGVGVGVYVYRLTMRYVGEGRVHLVEEDLERFLEEEDALSGSEGPPSTDPPSRSDPGGEMGRTTLLAIPIDDVEARASGEWDVGLDEEDEDEREGETPLEDLSSAIHLVDTRK